MKDTTNARRVLIVDDHPIVRHGLGQLIGQEKDLVVCGEASTCKEALEVFGQAKPDVVMVDISLPDSSGITLIKQIRDLDAEVPILVLSMHDESMYAERALRAGANGYVMKEQADSSVIEAIRKVLSGEMYVSADISARLLRQFIGGKREDPTAAGLERLSDRELEIFGYIGQGLSSQRIAEKLDLSVKTVEAHRAHIKKKLGIEDATQLMHRAIRWVEREGKGS